MDMGNYPDTKPQASTHATNSPNGRLQSRPESHLLRRRWMIAAACALVSCCLFTPAASADVVTEWNAAALNAIRAQRMNPPQASRAMAIAHAAIHDALNGIEPAYRAYAIAGPGPAGANRDAAIAAAGYNTLRMLFTNADVQTTNLLALYNAQLANIPDSASKTAGVTWGQSVAEALLALRASDGSTNIVPYTPQNTPGYWRPTPPANAPALLPGWGNVKPFTMISGAQFRPQAPPVIDGATYAYELNTVKAYGGTVSAVRTANQTEIALFWDDGAGTTTPPGHWNLIAQEISVSRNLSVPENARLFALLNLAAADAAICAWDAKYAFNLWRPITAVQLADTDGNPETEPDPTWTPLIPTPPFPEYTSGHSTFSRSAATVLAAIFGTDAIPFTIGSDGTPNVTRSFPSFGTAADEAGISRLFGGIHWPSGNLHAQTAGWRLGIQAARYFLQPLAELQFAQVRRTAETTDLTVHGEPNRPYQIRASSDLQTWEVVATLASADGILRFRDVNAGNLELRFYAAVAQ